jgi:hypothetical protein
MILNDQQMGQILELLIPKTREQMLDWHHEHGRVWHALPNQATVELTHAEGRPEFTMQVKGAAGEMLGQLQASAEVAGSNVGPSLRDLYDAALRTAGQSFFMEIVDSLKLTDFTAAATTTTAAPPQITADQAATVLKRLTGHWDLDCSRGKERVTIREDGAYLISSRPETTFRLKVLAWNEATSTAEVAKDRPDGRRLQIEYLKITSDGMIGHAKHDMHKLTYTRVAK